MKATLQDRQDIADLMTGWIYRDIGDWDQLRALFHPDARIEVTWFEGLATEFVDASIRMGASDLHTKHLISAPVVSFSPDATRAVSETNAVILAENVSLGLGSATYNRLIDRLARRDGVWRILDRQAVYDLSSFTFPAEDVDIDRQALARYPREYAALAYLLDASGYPVQRRFATRGSELERGIRQSAIDWLGRDGRVAQ
jgi:hypothetical protein